MRINPSAFLPFCDFGGNMSAMGVNIDLFEFPVCNSFKAKLMNDQLCYEVDLNLFSDNKYIEKYLELGLNFLMDYNEDRQLIFEKNTGKKVLGLANSVDIDKFQHALVYLDTIGKYVTTVLINKYTIQSIICEASCHPVTQSLGHLIIQSFGHLVTRSLGHLITQSLSHSIAQSLDHLDLVNWSWSLGHLVTWSLGHKSLFLYFQLCDPLTHG